MQTQIEIRECSRCKHTYPLTSRFFRVKTRGFTKVCLSCLKSSSEYGLNHQESRRLYTKKYYKSNREAILLKGENYYKLNKGKRCLAAKKYRKENQEKCKASCKRYRELNIEKCRALDRAYRNKNKMSLLAKRMANSEKLKAYRKEYNSANRLKINKAREKRMKTDPAFCIMTIARNRLGEELRKISKSKPNTTRNIMGCSSVELKEYIEAQFTEGMTWKNRGLFGWHIDHIKPCAAFDLTDPAQLAECFHYSNLQPLWAKDNLSKGAKWA